MKRFPVGGVPGAFGWTAMMDDRSVANVIWVEGRCIITLGNEMRPLPVDALTAGVQAQHFRIAGRCPDEGPGPSVAEPRELWPRPSDALALTREAGLVAERKEHLVFHVHSHLDVFVNGTPVQVPPGIGINVNDPAVGTFPNADGTTSYGGIQDPCKQPCISPLHTHDPDGVLHTESKGLVPNLLGRFFTEWGVALTASCVGQFCEPETSIAIYVNGKPYQGDPRDITLLDRREIALVIGTPPDVIPSVMPE